MADVLKSDIFFVVATVAVVLVTVGVLVALGYLIGILRDARALTKAVKQEGEEMIEDVRSVRSRTVLKVSRLLDKFPGGSQTKKGKK